MPTRNFSHDFPISSHCDVDWDSMSGIGRVRFCKHCERSVHLLDQMTAKEIARLVRESRGRLCVRYSLPAPVISAPIQISRRLLNRSSVLAASVFTAGLSVTGTMASTLPSRNLELNSAVHYSAHVGSVSVGSASLKGTIFDPNGAVIRGANVTLSNAEKQTTNTTYTDSQGSYHFDGLEPGTYNLKIEASGFSTNDVPDISLRANDDNRIDQTLSIASVEAEVVVSETSVMGAVAILPKEPLVKAAGADNLEEMRMILLQNVDPNVRDQQTHTTALEHAVRNGNREMIQTLLWAKADVNLRNPSGQTVLMMLDESATSDMVWDLINAGAKVNLRDHDGDNALIEAAEVNNVEVLKTLIDAGAKVNTANNEGKTALMAAAAEGHVNNVKALLMAGADVNIKDKEGKTALFYATDNGRNAVRRLLMSYGAVDDPPPVKEDR